ncbi:MAG: prolipoprotein diacylglyceryl transferase, partial [Candidatus Krumholzibacteria bacterium]|nr:prolipoprotein diacylglyceryl transferase [Candidatus Krumholzibacteria bacterium]
GMTLYGGILLAIAASAWFLKKKGQDFLSLADILAPGLALGIFITRVGCFLNGCCYGLPTDCSIGVHFPEHSAASHSAREFLSGPSGSLEGIPLSPAVHPSQLYASFGGLLIFLALLWLPLRVRGLVFASFLLLYGIHRSIVDLFRFYDASGQGALGFTLSQWISLGLVLWSILLFYRILKGRSSGK